MVLKQRFKKIAVQQADLERKQQHEALCHVLPQCRRYMSARIVGEDASRTESTDKGSAGKLRLRWVLKTEEAYWSLQMCKAWHFWDSKWGWYYRLQAKEEHRGRWAKRPQGPTKKGPEWHTEDVESRYRRRGKLLEFQAKGSHSLNYHWEILLHRRR